MTWSEDRHDLVGEEIKKGRVLVSARAEGVEDAVQAIRSREIKSEELVIPKEFVAGDQNRQGQISYEEN